MVNSIRKGKRFEREIAKKLSKLTSVKWHRTPSSGAMSTTQSITDNRFKGDIFTEDERYNYIVIECKITKKKITLSDLLNPNSIIYKWISQTLREAESRDWILIFKDGTRKTYLVAYPYMIPSVSIIDKEKEKRRFELVRKLSTGELFIRIGPYYDVYLMK